MIENKDLIDFMSKQAPGVTIAGFGGLVHYLYKVHKGELFSFSRLVINIVIAGWIGYLCQEGGISAFYTSIAGFCAYPLLDILETKGGKIIMEILFTKK